MSLRTRSSVQAWTLAMIRHRRLVISVWATLAIAGAVGALSLPSLLVNSLSVPGTPSAKAETILTKGFGESTEGTFVVAFLQHDQSKRAVAVLQKRLAAAARRLPHAVATKLQLGAGVVYGDVSTPLDLQQAERWTPVLRRALAAGPPRQAAALVTGEPALQYDLNPILATDLHRGDVIALVAALVILTLVLGFSYAVLVPFLFAAATITTTLGALWIVAHFFTISSYAPNLADLIGIGLAIDYSLLIVHRFREELSRDDDTNMAVVRTMSTAGRATVVSGGAVALGLLVVLATPVPFVRSLGLAGFLVPLFSVAAVVTLQPALLSLLGPRLLAPLRRRISGAGWERFARTVTRRPGLLLALSLTVLVACAVWAGGLSLTPGSIAAIPQNIGSARGLSVLDSNAGPGEITPVEIVIDSGARLGTTRHVLRAAINRLVNIASSYPESYVTAYGWSGPYVSANRRYARVFIVGRHTFGSAPMQALVRWLRRHAVPSARFPPGAHVYVGGASAQGVDYLDSIYGSTLWFALAVLTLAFLVLTRAFRSVPLAASAVVLNLLSALATLGLLVIVFGKGVGASVLGLYHLPQIEGWIPVFLVAMLFGLSMDYEVFLVLRIREAHEQGADTATAVREGLKRTGPVISAAAAIMVAAFSAFLAGRVAGLQEFGAGLALAVALDATVVRLLLVPSLVVLLGRHAWWLPGRQKPAGAASPHTLAQTPEPDGGCS
ncbi:MAG: MMPL family transporter [Solirubrobacteraceae bacterium]